MSTSHAPTAAWPPRLHLLLRLALVSTFVGSAIRLLHAPTVVGIVVDIVAGSVLLLAARRARASEGVALPDEPKMRGARTSGFDDLEAYQVGLDSQAIVGVTDSKGTIIEVNNRFVAVSGYARSELLGQNHRLLNSGTHPPEFWRNMWRTVGRGQVWRAEVCNRAKDGSLYWVDTSIVPFRAGPNRERRYISIRYDVTEAKRATQRAQEIQERLQKLTAQLPDVAVFQYRVHQDGTAHFPYASPGISIYGVSAEAVAADGNVAFDAVHPDDAARVRASIAESAAQLSAWSQEYRVRLPDGRERWVASRARPEREPDGALLWHGVAADVTEHHRAMEEVARAKETAERATRAKSEFLAAMSHEIRTPMNGVLGFANLLLDTPLDDKQMQFVRTIQSSGQDLLAIINDILDFSKIEAGALTLERVPFELREAAEDVVRLLTSKAQEKGLELDLTLAPEVPSNIVSDPGRLKQILMNLAGNAIKFTDAGRVRIHVGVVATAPPGVPTLEFSVSDTGIGMSEAVRARLFQKFTQADASTTRRYGGTGLGLAICRQLLERLGGSIHVDSEVGVGSTFRFVLPVEISQVAPARLTAVAESAPHAATDARVLVAEDNPVNQRLALHLLTRLGCHVDLAATGAEAVEMSSRTAYDLVLMDCHMPGMDGFDATRAIRLRESTAGAARTPIVALTASVLEEDRRRCDEAGMDGFVGKPFRANELGAMLDRHARAVEHPR